MKNKILCLLALLLSAITCTGDTFATTPVEIQRMSSFKSLPPTNDECQSLSLERYSALIRKLNDIRPKIAGMNSFLWPKKEDGEYFYIKDFTRKGKILAQAALYDCMEFLRVKEYSSSNSGNVFSLDYSWPNIRRIAEELADKGADTILKETFHRTKYAVKCINDEESKKYQEIARDEIKKNLEALKNLLEKIDEVKIKPEERSRVTFTGNQINEFINLCVGEDAVFNTMSLNDVDQGLFRARLGEMLQNYSGFQRICSILAMRLINTIMSRGVRGVSIDIGTEGIEGNAYFYSKNKIYVTPKVLSGYHINYYDQNNGEENASTMYHEMTHFFHRMINGILVGSNSDFERSLRSMVVYNICNSKHSLLDLFFPVLSHKKMGSIVGKIQEKLENLDKAANSTKAAIYSIYQNVVQAGFGNLLFRNDEIESLSFENLCESGRLAKAIYLKSGCLIGDEALIWSTAEEMLTIMGIVPLLVDGDKTYMLEERQNEEVYNIRGEKGEFQSNKDIKKFRYHGAYEYKRLLAKINARLGALSAPELEPNEVPGIDEMQFPEHLPFSSTSGLNKPASTKVDNDIIKQCENSLNKYIGTLEKKEQTDLLEYFIEKGYINLVEFLSEKVLQNFDWAKVSLNRPIESGDLGMLHLILSKRGSSLKREESNDILQYGALDVIKEIVADVDLSMDISGSRPLNCVLKRGFPGIAKMLLDKGADVNTTDRSFDTPLHYAAEKGYVDIVDTLISKNANVAVEGCYSHTPLYLAAKNGHVAIVKALLKAGADASKTTWHNKTPLDEAAETFLCKKKYSPEKVKSWARNFLAIYDAITE
ncbi:MAG: ankyrin repeat domain-containing protein, partial [Holosporaceae bacterium]|nr:ankyrin repeat domain-containing protein [Holosporaceae bacterium]